MNRGSSSSRRRHISGIIMAAALLALGPVVGAHAQSPTPNHSFVDTKPGSNNILLAGAVVEGLGMGACPYSLSSVETSTVSYIDSLEAVLTEISPQSACGTIAQYESWINSLITYVESHASNPGNYWGGIMLDEEWDWGFSVSQLVTLNNYVESKMSATPGVSWWYTEVFSGTNNWSFSNYISIVDSSIPSPQIASNYMVTLVNSCGCTNLVTWSTTYPAPFNTKAYSVAKINGAPYNHDFYGCFCNYYWDNRFVPV